MVDWPNFQEDFWKVLSNFATGNNEDEEENQEPVKEPPKTAEERVEKQASKGGVSVPDKSGDWVKTGVWDPRVPHPVPAFPRVLDDGLIATLSHNPKEAEEERIRAKELEAWKFSRDLEEGRLKEKTRSGQRLVAKAESKLAVYVAPGHRVIKQHLSGNLDEEDGLGLIRSENLELRARRLQRERKNARRAEALTAEEEAAAKAAAKAAAMAAAETRRVMNHLQAFERYEAYKERVQHATRSEGERVVAGAGGKGQHWPEDSAEARVDEAMGKARLSVLAAKQAATVVAAYKPGGVAARIFAGEAKGLNKLGL